MKALAVEISMFGTPDKYQVTPTGSRWQVIRGFETLSKHDKKSTAVRKAKRTATEGDKLTVRKKDGTIQTQMTV